MTGHTFMVENNEDVSTLEVYAVTNGINVFMENEDFYRDPETYMNNVITLSKEDAIALRDELTRLIKII